MTAPAEELSWACGTCHKKYPHTDHGKAFAEACCTCPVCKGPTGGKHIGLRAPCARCAAEAELKDAQAAGVDAVCRIDRAQRVLERLKSPDKNDDRPGAWAHPVVLAQTAAAVSSDKRKKASTDGP